MPVTDETIITNRAMRRNIVRVLRLNKSLARRERAWYGRANRWVVRLAQASGRDAYLVASVAAAVSPSVEWRDNRRMVLALLRDDSALTFRNRKGNIVSMVGYGANIAKARAMLRLNDATLLRGPKVTAFRDALLGMAATVIDVHATNIAMGVMSTVYSGPDKFYAAFVEAYEDVARMLGWQAHEVQSAAWVVFKSVKAVRS